MATATGTSKWCISFAQCEQVCTSVDQELNDLGISTDACYMEGRITQIAGFVDVDPSVDENLSRREIAPPHNTVKCVITIAAIRVHITEIRLSKVCGLSQSCKDFF